MDDQGRQNLPNLKICVDNTEEGELSDSDESMVPAIAVDIDEDEKIDDEKEHDVEFSIKISDLPSENKTKTRAEIYKKKYENRDGDFITGIDLTSKEAIEKREERARRFGIDVKENPFADEDIKDLYASLGLKEDDFHKGERGVRPEAIHLRGTDQMSTQDVFRYFKEFAPGGVEWIDDSSCNAVWADPVTAARAMMRLSDSYETVMDIKPKSDISKTKQEGGDGDGIKGKKEETKEETREETMEVEEEDDSLDLLDEDDEKAEKKEEAKKDIDMDSDSSDDDTSRRKKETKKEDNPEEDSSKAETETDDQTKKSEGKSDVAKRNKIAWPPGKWRLGHGKHKLNKLFLRFATRADKKLPRAESRSKYYVKYGNPNYGGMKGLISTSRKRRYRAKTFEEELAETKAAIESQRASREARERGSHWEEEKEEEVEEEEEEVRDLPRVSPLKRKRGGSDGEGEELDMEAELQELLGPPTRKQRSMRMYADDEEEMRSSKRRLGGGSSGVLTVMADTARRPPVGKVKDARELIRRGGGGGMRSQLMMDKEREESPDPVSYSRSGSLRMRIRASPSVSGSEEEEEQDSDSQSEEETDTRPSILSRLGPAGRGSDSDSESGGSERDFRGRLGVSKALGTDLRSRLGAQKHKDNSKYPSMRIEVFE